MDPLPAAADDDRRAFRLAVCARFGPWALPMAGGALLVVTAVNTLIGTPVSVMSVGLNVVVACLLIGVGLLGRADRTPRAAWPWLVAVCATLLVVDGQFQVFVAPDGSSFAYILVIMVASSPLTLAWVPAVGSSFVMVVGCVVVAQRWPGTEPLDWIVVAVTASVVGLGLMWLRLQAVDELAVMTARARRLATVDELTGLLNRHGVRERLRGIVGLADRTGQPVMVVFLDVRGLKAANDTLGHEVGDRLLRAVADSLTGVARAGDVIGRWGGDEFVIVGLGLPSDPSTLEARLEERIRRAGSDARCGPVRVSAGAAARRIPAGPDAAADIDALIAEADADMYRRRSSRGTPR